MQFIKQHSRLLTKTCAAAFFAGLLVTLRGLFYHDTGTGLALSALLLMIASLAGIILSLLTGKSHKPQPPEDYAEINRSSAQDRSSMPDHFSFAPLQTNASAGASLQYLLHLINPEKSLAAKVGLALQQLPEIFAESSFLYFSFEESRLRFIAGSRRNARGLCALIPEGDSLIEDVNRKIQSCIDVRAVKKAGNFTSPVSFATGSNDERGLLLPVSFFSCLHGVVATISTVSAGLKIEQQQILEDFCMGLALMLENHDLFHANAAAKQLEAEQLLASTLLAEMLPDHGPAIRGWDIAQITHYADEHSGDFHAYLNIPGERLMIVIGKCSGRGLKTALFLTRFKAMVSCLVEQCPTPSDLLNRLSIYMNSENMNDLFATAAALLIKASERSVSLALAGHPVPLINRSRSGYVEVPQLDSGVPLGLFNKGVEPYKNQTIQLLPGDGILLYTEGVTEFPVGDRERISLEELRLMLDRSPEQNAAVMLENLEKQLMPGKPALRPVEDHTLIYAKSE